LKTYLLVIAAFCNEVKGKNMLAFALDLGVQHKMAFVPAHKLREAMASSMKALQIGGEGRTAKIDGAYFGGHVRPLNLAVDRVDRRLAENRSGKRKVVVVMRERDGGTLPTVFASEDAAVSFIQRRIAKGTIVRADESPAWNPLHAKFSMKRISHEDGYNIDGARTNGRSPISAASAVANWGITIISPAPILPAMFRKQHGGKISVASATAPRSIASSAWRCGLSHRSIFAGIGSAAKPARLPAKRQP
jgi:ISXO2-like transposase domain